MSELSSLFPSGSKVVISPDKMRAWVSLVRPAKGSITAEAITEWLPQQGVTFGADAGMIRAAVGELSAGKYEELLEVARGRAPVQAAGGSYTFTIEKKPFTGLRALSDGSLVYDDFSFLQEVQKDQVLAEIVPPVTAVNGCTVTGQEVPPRGEPTPGKELAGAGFVMSEDGRKALAPCLAHVNIVNDELVVTPLKKVEKVNQQAGAINFDGNVVVEGDVSIGGRIEASGSIFVAGRCVSANISAGNNVLLASGMRTEGAFGLVEAKKGNVWGPFFESCEITAGGDICANHLSGCEAEAGGRANIIGGRGSITATTLYARNGVVAGQLGDASGGEAIIKAGADKKLIDHYNTLDKKIERLTIEIQSLQQNLQAHERINKMRADKGKGDAAYKEMTQKRQQSLSVLKILTDERTRNKRTLDAFANVSVVVRGDVFPGVSIVIDDRLFEVKTPMQRTKFRRNKDVIEAVANQQR